jgi:isopenicillin N synthase-like dioxygenase
LLFQDSIGGLEVEIPNKPGTFVAVPPLANSLVMNVGDLLMRWSNGQSNIFTYSF